MFFFNKQKSFIVFYLILIVVVFFTTTFSVLNLPPKGVHQWRQSDVAATIKNYYRNDNFFFSPATYNLAGKEGRVVSEFPILSYTAAKIQKVIGEHNIAMRALQCFIALVGMGYLLAILQKVIASFWVASSIAILAFLSPFYCYYASSFMPNIPAISLSIIGLYYWITYSTHRQKKHLWLATLFTIIATLLKPTDGGILFIAWILTFMWVTKGKGLNKHYGVAIFLIALANIAWVYYVKVYNTANGNHQNLQSIYPIWDMDNGLMKYTFQRTLGEWSGVYFPPLVWKVIGIGWAVFFLFFKRLPEIPKKFTLMITVGALCYALLWFKAFTDHDYYQLVLWMPNVSMLLCVGSLISKLNPRNGIKFIAGVAMLGLIVYNLKYTRNVMIDRYNNPVYAVIPDKMFTLEPYLKSLGIDESQKVICAPDKSPNASLNAINRYGFTEEFNSPTYGPPQFIKQGASVLIISDSAYLHHPAYANLNKVLIGVKEGTYIFRLFN